MAFDPKNLEIVDDYLAGRLSDADRDLFEEELLVNIDLQSALFAQKELKLGLQDISDEILTAPRQSITQRFYQIISSASWGYVVTAMLLIGIGWTVLPGAQPGLHTITGSVIDQVVYIEQMRSSEPTAIEISPKNRTLLSFDAIGLTAGSANFRLYQNNSLQMELLNLAPNDELSINIILPELDTGSYKVELGNVDLQLEFELLVGL